MKPGYLLLLLLFLTPLLVFFHTRGVVPHDEGYILHSAEKFLNGQIPYRDFEFVYTPLSVIATSLTFKVLGVSILSSRILMILVSLFASLLLFKTIMLSTKNKLYATLSVLLFLAWGPTHINFSWPVMFAIPTGLLTCYLLLKFLETRNMRHLFLAGISVVLVFAAKQNFGIAMLVPIFVLFLTKNMRNHELVLKFMLGLSWGTIIFISYLLITGSFPAFINDFYAYTIDRVIIQNRLTTPFVYYDSFLKAILRTTLYTIPLLLSIATFALLYMRRRFHLLFLPIFVIAFYVVGIRPTTDYIHLVPLLSLIGIPISLYLRYNVITNIRIAFFVFILFMVVVGIQTAIWKGYYRWDQPIIFHDNFYNNSRVNIFISSKFAYEFDELLKITSNYTKKGDYIMVDSYNPIYYFVTQRSEPTKNNFLLMDIDEKKYYQQAQAELIAKRIKILITNENRLINSPLNMYVSANYRHLLKTQDFDIYVRIEPWRQ